MKALKYIEELIEFEESYLSQWTDENKSIPVTETRRLNDLKLAKKELLEISKKIR